MNLNEFKSVRFERRIVTDTSTNMQLEVGSIKAGNIVLAIKFSNIGENSIVHVGSPDGMEIIPGKGAAEISFGTGYPNCIEDEFTISFEKIIPALDSTHACLVIETVLNNC